MYTPKEWKKTLKDWSSTLDSWFFFWICKENMFWNILHLSKSDWFLKRSRIIISSPPLPPLVFLGSCHCNVFDDEWPAHKSVSVLEKRSCEHLEKLKCCFWVRVNQWKWMAVSMQVCSKNFSLLWSITL